MGCRNQARWGGPTKDLEPSNRTLGTCQFFSSKHQNAGKCQHRDRWSLLKQNQKSKVFKTGRGIQAIVPQESWSKAPVNHFFY